MRFKTLLLIVAILYVPDKDRLKLSVYGHETRHISGHDTYTKKDIEKITGRTDLIHFRQRTLKKMLHYGQKYRIPEQINIRLVYAESRFNNMVVSSCGAKYVYQISSANIRYYRSIGITDPFEMGCKFLRDRKNEYGTWTRALKYYNSGHADSRHKGVIKFANFITQSND